MAACCAGRHQGWNWFAGTYRHLQARLRNNAESVAFYGGVEKEGRLIVHKFKDLLRHHERLLKTQWQYGMVQVSLGLCSLSNCVYHHRWLGKSHIFSGAAPHVFVFTVCGL